MTPVGHVVKSLRNGACEGEGSPQDSLQSIDSVEKAASIPIPNKGVPMIVAMLSTKLATTMDLVQGPLDSFKNQMKEDVKNLEATVETGFRAEGIKKPTKTVVKVCVKDWSMRGVTRLNDEQVLKLMTELVIGQCFVCMSGKDR